LEQSIILHLLDQSQCCYLSSPPSCVVERARPRPTSDLRPHRTSYWRDRCSWAAASRRPTRIRSSGRSCARPRSLGLVVHAEKGDGGLTDAERATRDAAPLVAVVRIPGAVFFLPDETPRRIAEVTAAALKQPQVPERGPQRPDGNCPFTPRVGSVDCWAGSAGAMMWTGAWPRVSGTRGVVFMPGSKRGAEERARTGRAVVGGAGAGSRTSDAGQVQGDGDRPGRARAPGRRAAGAARPGRLLQVRNGPHREPAQPGREELGRSEDSAVAAYGPDAAGGRRRIGRAHREVFKSKTFRRADLHHEQSALPTTHRLPGANRTPESIQPCLRADHLAAVHSPTWVSPNIEDLSIDKPLSHEAAACGREDRHRTGVAVILVWVGVTLVRMAEILRPLRPEPGSVRRGSQRLSMGPVRRRALSSAL
jgi:hypothetical protein